MNKYVLELMQLQATFYCCFLRLLMRLSRLVIKTAGRGVRLPTRRSTAEQPPAPPAPDLRHSGRGIMVPRALQLHLIQVIIRWAGL